MINFGPTHTLPEIDFDPIRQLLEQEPNIGKHSKVGNCGVEQVGDGGCNRAIYRLRKPEINKTPDSRHTGLHSPPPGIVYKVNRRSIPASKQKEMRACLEFLAYHYEMVREFGKPKGLNIAPFSTKLIPDRSGYLRVVSAEPDVGGIFKDHRVIDLSHANMYSNPEAVLSAVLSDDRALESLINIIDLCRKFYEETKENGRPMHLDIWGENNILGINDVRVLTEHGLHPNHWPEKPGYPLFGNSSLLKANDSDGLFNERADFRLIISLVLDSLERIIEKQGKPIEERGLRFTPIEKILFYMANTKTALSRAGINF